MRIFLFTDMSRINLGHTHMIPYTFYGFLGVSNMSIYLHLNVGSENMWIFLSKPNIGPEGKSTWSKVSHLSYSEYKRKIWASVNNV